MKARLLGGIAAFILAIAGTFLLVIYVQNADARAQQGLEPVNVLIVEEKIPASTPVSEIREKVSTEAVPRSAVPKGSVETLTDHSGKVAAVDLLPGEYLLDARLVNPGQLTPGTVPVPDGMEEVTFLLEPERMLGGRLQAGDKVGVFVSGELEDNMPEGAPVPEELYGWKEFTSTVYQDVLVTAVQKASPEAEDSTSEDGVEMPSGSAYVTVARDDADTARMVFAAEFGSIWLSKRTDDSNQSDPPIMTFEKVFQ